MRWALTVLAILTPLSCFAQNAQDTALGLAIQNSAQAAGHEPANVCHGPVIDNSLAGVPGDEVADIRCQEVSLDALECHLLATEAGTYLSWVDDGEKTMAQIEQEVENEVPGSAEDYAGLVLAEQAPPSVPPAQWHDEIFSLCMSDLGR